MSYKDPYNEGRAKYALHQTKEWKEYQSLYAKAYRINNPDKIKMWRQNWQKKNAEKVRKYSRDWCRRNPDKVKKANAKLSSRMARKKVKENYYMRNGKWYKLPEIDIQLNEELEEEENKKTIVGANGKRYTIV